MTVYVITKGSYSDYHIEAVTLDAEVAEKIRRVCCDGWDEARIEEYETDSFFVSDDPVRIWNFTVTGEGYVHDGPEEWTTDDEWKNVFGFRRGYEFYAGVKNKDRDVALKIALDQRAKMLAKKLGL